MESSRRFKVKELEQAFLDQKPPVERPPDANEGHVRFAEYVNRHVRPDARILDVGCGEGAMVRLLSSSGFRATGVDVRPHATGYFRGLTRPGQTFCVGSGTALPFQERRFEAVTCFDVLEHIYDVETVLFEGHRVLVPGGRLIVVSPNLLSPIHSLSALVSAFLGKEGFHLFRHRDPPTSPFGNHVPEIGWILVRNLALTLTKLARRRPRPSYRVPDPRYVGWGDSDSVYLCNPVEVRQFLTILGMKIVAYQGEGTTGPLGPLAGGVWIVAEKGDSTDPRLPDRASAP